MQQQRRRDRGRQLDTKHSPSASGEAEELEVSETSPELALKKHNTEGHCERVKPLHCGLPKEATSGRIHLQR